MKKTLTLVLALILTLSLLTACGGNGGNSSLSTGSTDLPSSDSAADKQVIYASALLSVDDVGNILGTEMFGANFMYNNIDRKESSVYDGVSSIKCDYWSDNYTVSISFFQDVASYVEMEINKIEAQIKTPSESDIEHFTALDGIGDKAYLSHLFDDSGICSIYVFYGDHCIVSMLVNVQGVSATTSRGNEEEMAWRQDKVTECGKLALEHLKEILAGTRSPESNVPVSDRDAAVDKGMNKAVAEVIKPSKLISAKDAGDIFGETLRAEKEYVDIAGMGSTSSLSTVYLSDSYAFMLDIYQDALFIENDDRIMRDGGMSYYIKEQIATFDAMKEMHPSEVQSVEGVGDGGYYVFVDGNLLMKFYYGAYWMEIVSGSVNGGSLNSDEAKELQKAKLAEAGKLIVEHLKAIVG